MSNIWYRFRWTRQELNGMKTNFRFFSMIQKRYLPIDISCEGNFSHTTNDGSIFPRNKWKGRDNNCWWKINRRKSCSNQKDKLIQKAKWNRTESTESKRFVEKIWRRKNRWTWKQIRFRSISTNFNWFSVVNVGQVEMIRNTPLTFLRENKIERNFERVHHEQLTRINKRKGMAKAQRCPLLYEDQQLEEIEISKKKLVSRWISMNRLIGRDRTLSGNNEWKENDE